MTPTTIVNIALCVSMAGNLLLGVLLLWQTRRWEDPRTHYAALEQIGLRDAAKVAHEHAKTMAEIKTEGELRLEEIRRQGRELDLSHSQQMRQLWDENSVYLLGLLNEHGRERLERALNLLEQQEGSNLT